MAMMAAIRHQHKMILGLKRAGFRRSLPHEAGKVLGLGSGV